MKHIHKSVVWFSLLTITLSSCDLNLISSLPSLDTSSTSSSFSVSISEGTPNEVFDFFEALSIQEPYFTEHLPSTNDDHSPRVDAMDRRRVYDSIWFLIHPFLPNDLQPRLL
jgi:hypothetical protein